MPKLTPDDQAAFDRVVTSLDHDDKQDVSKSLDLDELCQEQVIEIRILEEIIPQTEAVLRLCKANRQGLLDATRRCTGRIREEILTIMLAENQISWNEASKYL